MKKYDVMVTNGTTIERTGSFRKFDRAVEMCEDKAKTSVACVIERKSGEVLWDGGIK